jgi:hypothetical protein
MNILRKNRSLRYRTKHLIRDKHSDLFKSKFVEYILNVQEYSFDRKRWWFILLLVTIVFCISLIINNFGFLNFISMETSTAKILVDQRTSNIATITSITLVVVGFLINNLAVKESYAYSLLFKHSYLYPIVYLILSTIGCLFIVSSLRDELDNFQFNNAVLAGTYLSIIILFFIGFLFKKIIDFTDEKKIRGLLHKELMIESIRSLKQTLLKKYSNELYKNEMVKENVKEYDWTGSIDYANFNAEMIEIPEQNISVKYIEKYLFDVNLKSLKKFILKKQNNSEQVSYRDLSLGETITYNDRYILEKDKAFTNKEKLVLKKCLKLKKNKQPLKENNTMRKYFDNKLEDLSNKSDYRNLEDLLSSYYELYKLQIDNQK